MKLLADGRVFTPTWKKRQGIMVRIFRETWVEEEWPVIMVRSVEDTPFNKNGIKIWELQTVGRADLYSVLATWSANGV